MAEWALWLVLARGWTCGSDAMCFDTQIVCSDVIRRAHANKMLAADNYRAVDIGAGNGDEREWPLAVWEAAVIHHARSKDFPMPRTVAHKCTDVRERQASRECGANRCRQTWQTMDVGFPV